MFPEEVVVIFTDIALLEERTMFFESYNPTAAVAFKRINKVPFTLPPVCAKITVSLYVLPPSLETSKPVGEVAKMEATSFVPDIATLCPAVAVPKFDVNSDKLPLTKSTGIAGPFTEMLNIPPFVVAPAQSITRI